MGGALGLRAARCEPFGRGLSGAAREQSATVGVGPARTVGGVLWGPRSTRTANGRADRPHLGWAYVVVAVRLPTPQRFTTPLQYADNGSKKRCGSHKSTQE